MDSKEKIMEILNEIRPEYDFTKSKNFIKDGLLDSFDMVSLVSELETQYGIIIDGLDIVPENFVSVKSIVKVIKKNGGNV